jgi:hypothetical protein
MGVAEIVEPDARHSRERDLTVEHFAEEIGIDRRAVRSCEHGRALSACRYFESTLPQREQPLGLGTRHIAAASISAATGAVLIVVSESSIVRLYAAGALITEILPELWLLHRYMPHITEPNFTKDRTHNLGIVSERTEQPSL